MRFNLIQHREPHQGRRQNEGQADDFARRAERWCMATVSSCRKVSCQVRQRARPVPTIANGLFEACAHCGDCLGNEEEGAGHGRSVCPKYLGLHARNNGRDNGTQPREGKLILETLSQSRSRAATRPRDVGIPSNQVLAAPGEYVPAPCTHRPSNHSSRV